MIYLDNNATTRVLPEVVEALLPFYTQGYGNPSSMHQLGAFAAQAVEDARQQVADLLGAGRAHEIIFTSGGTESNNLAIRGVLKANPTKKHLITTLVEHPSVLSLCQQLEKEGYGVTYLKVDAKGAIDLRELQEAITVETALVSVMWANNETGIIFPIQEIAKICAAKNVLFHCDAVQACAKIPIDLKKIPLNLLSISGHKFHAPKGVGALYIRRGTILAAQIIGGSQEKNLRGGTQNVAGIVGIGKAAQILKKHLDENLTADVKKLRDRFEEKLLQKFPWIVRNGHGEERVPNTSNLSFGNLDGETILILLNEKGIATSTGSACKAGLLGPSHVLKAMGIGFKQASATLRFSLNFETTQEEIDQTITVLESILQRLTKNSPMKPA